MVVIGVIGTSVGLLIIWFLYVRYFPVLDVKEIEAPKQIDENLSIVDVRDFNEVAMYNPELNTTHIPLSYIQRYYTDFHSKEIILIVSDNLGKNIGIRFLRRKGFKVRGYIKEL